MGQEDRRSRGEPPTACEVCWDLAFVRSRTLGGHQADHYRDLLIENEGEPDHSPPPVEGGQP